MSFLTRSALLAGSSLKSGAKVSDLHLFNIKISESKNELSRKLKVKKIQRKRLSNHEKTLSAVIFAFVN